jgi:anti-sigma B factor antagonist
MIEFERADAEPTLRRVAIKGRLDSAGIAQSESPLNEALSAAQCRILFDLSGVSFIGSLGIRMFVSVARTWQKVGCRVVLYGMQPRVLEVFETVSLGDLIPLVEGESDARTLLAEC